MSGPESQNQSGLGELRCVLAAIQFLTRLPVPEVQWSDDLLGRSQRYFPVAGLLIGALAALIWLAAHMLLTASLAAGLAIAALIVMSGALHEDGLADLADGLGARGGSEKALEIMRDSRIGTFGTIALILAIGLKWMALAALPVVDGALALVIAPAIGRAVMVPIAAFGLPARSDGLGASLGTNTRPEDVCIALGIALIAAIFSGIGVGLLAVAGGLVASLGLFLFVTRRLGGYTGDVLGAVAVVAETAALCVFAGASS